MSFKMLSMCRLMKELRQRDGVRKESCFVSQKCLAPSTLHSESQVQPNPVWTHSYQLPDTSGRKSLQTMSSQSKYLNEHDALPKSPVYPEHNFSSHNSQQLPRLPRQCPDPLAYPQKPFTCNGDTNHYDSHSWVTNRKDSSLVEIMPTNDARLHKVSEEKKVCIPKQLQTFCFACRTMVKGEKILHHLLFGYMKCQKCNLHIRSCKEFEKINEEKHHGKNALDEMHDLMFCNPDIFDFLSFQIWQNSYDRAKGPPLSNHNLLEMLTYLRSLRLLFNVKPWGSVLRKCELHASNYCTLPSSNICSDSSIKNAKRKQASEEGMYVALKPNNLSENFNASDINMLGETISCSSEGNTNTSNVKGKSKSSVNSEPRIISASIVEERSRGSVKSKVGPSVELVVSKCLPRSESSSFNSFTKGIGSKDVIKSQTCSISAPIVKGDPKGPLRSSVKVDKRFRERKLRIPILQKGGRILEIGTNEEMSVKVINDEFKEGKVPILKTSAREKTSEEQEKTDGRNAVENRDWENIEANGLTENVAEFSNALNIVKEDIPELNEIETNLDIEKNEYFVEDSWATTELQPFTEFITCNNTSTVRGCGSQSRSYSSDEELFSQTEMNKNSNSQKKFDAYIDFLNGESDSDASSSISQNLDGRSNYSQNSENLNLPTSYDPSPLCKPSNLCCDEKQLLISFQTVETSGLANVKCPEECPMCYTVLCPSRFHVNLKTFHLTSRCLGCGLFITITLGDCENPNNTKRIYKRPGPMSKTKSLPSKIGKTFKLKQMNKYNM
ncbi:uncharacterized protein [Palaemon carinicauda]|uniref:uncharacterized protein n=1 Tax=Palaemon carinicauda TaxID=392227 RepID=UPI0035B675FB